MLYAFARDLVRFVYHIIFHITVVGKENIPEAKGGYIIASNHVSNNDPPLIGITFRGKYNFMAKEELFRNPLFAWLIRGLGAFPVKRGAKDGAAVQKGIECLKNGRIFVIFPEGTRSKTGELGKPKSGVAMIAAQAKVPVVPVFIRYGRKRFRRHILVSVGKMMPAEMFDVEISDKRTIRGISEAIMGEIATLKENAPDVD